MKKVRVLIVDDSALIRQLLTEILSSDPEIEVVGTAIDPHIARQKIKELNPDVLTLDVEMPKMDGISFLRQLIRLRPMPVVMLSSLTEKGAETTLEALSLGAVDFVAKPKTDLSTTLQDYAEEIITKVKEASKVKVIARDIKRPVKKDTLPSEPYHVKQTIDEKYSATVVLKRPDFVKSLRISDKIIAIGASTGGTEAIRDILVNMKPNSPAILITQHIPPVFSTAFAKRMDSCCPMSVIEATDGCQVLPGHVYIAPGHRHLLLASDGVRFICRLNDGHPVNRHKPSVDVLFRSVAQNAGKNSIGVILTGMGADGARGLNEMREAGAITIAQDEKSSVVWGMPGEAVKCGAAQKIVALSKIPEILHSSIMGLEKN